MFGVLLSALRIVGIRRRRVDYVAVRENDAISLVHVVIAVIFIILLNDKVIIFKLIGVIIDRLGNLWRYYD